MKTESWNLTWLSSTLAAIVGGALLMACNFNTTSQPQTSTALNQLRADHENVLKLRRENQELARLRQDHAELQKLRPFSIELAKLRAENQELRTQAGLKLEDRLAESDSPEGAGGKPGQPRTGAPGEVAAEDSAEVEINPADVPQEGDDILVEPKFLTALLPGFDWEKIERKEPISIKSIIEQKGIILTNYQQLVQLGLTNYVIRRNPPPVEP